MAETENTPGTDVEEQAPAPSSPLSNLVKSLGGGKKNAVAKPAKTSMANSAAVQAAKAQVNPAAPKVPGGPLYTIVTRNEFYRDGFRNLIKIAMLEGVVIVLLILALIVYINNSKPEDRYFATTADGRIMQLQPLNVPNLDTPALLSWVATAASDTMTFSYLNYQKELQNASKHFTKTGWESFTSAMPKAHVLDGVQAQQQIETAQPRSAPILVQQGVLNGKYRWVLQMPIAVKYQSTKESRTDQLQLQLVVERVPSLENPAGVGIAQWVATLK